MTTEELMLLAAIADRDLTAVPALADSLIERGDERGRLLKARWRRCENAKATLRRRASLKSSSVRREWEEVIDRLRAIPGVEVSGSMSVSYNPDVENEDDLLIVYVRGKFRDEWPESR